MKISNLFCGVFALTLFASYSQAAQAPVCGSRFLADFKKHYGFIECLSRGDKLCLSERIDEKSTTALASTAGASGAAAAKLASGKWAPAFLREGAKKAGSKIAWGAVVGGTYFIVTKAAGGVFGFLADTSEAGNCRDGHPWVYMVQGERRCEIAYKITDNPVAANFFNLKNESAQLDVLSDPMACNYFFNLHALIKAKGETAIVQYDMGSPEIFKDSAEPVTTPKTGRLPKDPKPSSEAAEGGKR